MPSVNKVTSGTPIRSIVVDVDDTLYTLSVSIGSVYARVLSRESISADADQIDAAVRQVWPIFRPVYLNIAGQHQTDSARERAVWDAFIVDVLAATGIVVDWKIREKIYAEFSLPEDRLVAPGAMRLLESLEAAGLVIVCASNNDARVHRLVEGLGVRSVASHCFTADELGWKKPSPRYFYAIQQRLDCRADEILHIGNDQALDIDAALRAGWRAIKVHYRDWAESEARIREIVFHRQRLES